MKPLTIDILTACGASARHAAQFVEPLNELLPYYRVTTYLRLSHFMAQILHESDRMRAVEEYASGETYEGRKDLGNTEPGDGVRFKGRGLIQLTGRANYTAFSKRFGVDVVANPELLEEPRWALVSALYYWNTRKLNARADADDVLAISQIINQGSVPRPGVKRRLPNGYDDRVALLARSKEAVAELFEDNGVE
ncbi:peptidoglycan-binding protein [Rudanella paleaurantiibacter]|uniref:Peptidoglycan-binding protein n=1 Tax=Rudanella paleaurantiibacter TaxID=2614655 RepID=A0A7J5TYB1_9BACT|nr:glycoside hydrolase family 19 protein [Rudanella paleaurantiibacter]KAB7730128.1 peptidoglycan-binding protein [Rudanella paleaurantiibacter]